MKKTQVYGWHKGGRVSANNDTCCKWCLESHPPWIYSKRAYCKQRNVWWNPLLPQGCSRKETSIKIVRKQSVSSGQHICTSVPGGQKVPCPRLVTAQLFLFLRLKNFLKRQWFASAEEVNANALWTLAKVCHCPRELLWLKCCVNRCKVTYFCVINQFWELSEASNISQFSVRNFDCMVNWNLSKNEKFLALF
jgi:hypothetical protein